MHDENVYSDPHTFKPERFLSKVAGGLGEPDCVPTVFGYGRRICPGQHLAASSLWIYAVHLFAVLDIMPLRNEDGDVVPPRAEPGPGIIRFVVLCSICLRCNMPDLNHNQHASAFRLRDQAAFARCCSHGCPVTA